jgi:hexulose-6-phosphate isomerase
VNAIGIMQGRLLPPIDGRIQAFPAERWREEFALAAAAGLAAIEWIYESPGEDRNPLSSDAGIAEMRALSTDHGVAVRSVCADYFMAHPLVRGEASELRGRVDHLRWLLDRCRAAGIERVVLPFVDASEVRTAAEEASLAAILEELDKDAAAAGIELHLEMSLAPARFAAFLGQLPERIRVNYDSGNSASLGYAVEDEFAAYGDRIGSVHVKDRVRGGGTVPLGHGDADLAALFAALRGLRYQGDLILQVARQTSGHELDWARHNRGIVEAALR